MRAFLDQYVEMHEWLISELPDNVAMRVRLRHVDSLSASGETKETVTHSILNLFLARYAEYPTLTTLPPDNDYAKVYHQLADGRDKFTILYAELHTTATALMCDDVCGLSGSDVQKLIFYFWESTSTQR